MSTFLSEEIRHALATDKPIVALETAVLTSGLPRCPWDTSYVDSPVEMGDDTQVNIAVAKSMTKAVRSKNAVPAWVGVLHGTLRVGLSDDEVIELACDPLAEKVSLATIASSMQTTKSAGTTVAATLLACRLASKDNPIRVFATGGIGGIHQHWSRHMDISADLVALATTPVCVVASGAKSILDLDATVASLETIGVPVLGIGHNRFPRFIEKNSEEDPIVHQVDSVVEVASICRSHWYHLGMRSSVLATVPVAAEVALDAENLIKTLAAAENAWTDSTLPPHKRTPFLLDYLADATRGKSLIANISLLISNASTAADIAIAMRE